MLCVNSYKQDYIDECRSSMESQLAAYETLPANGEIAVTLPVWQVPQDAVAR